LSRKKDTTMIKHNEILGILKIEKVRLHIVNHPKNYGIKVAARKFETSVKSVRKWVRCYDGIKNSLSNRSRYPRGSPNRLPMEIKNAIVAYRKRFPTFHADP